jgi:hypothetical protein
MLEGRHTCGSVLACRGGTRRFAFFGRGSSSYSHNSPVIQLHTQRERERERGARINNLMIRTNNNDNLTVRIVLLATNIALVIKEYKRKGSGGKTNAEADPDWYLRVFSLLS